MLPDVTRSYRIQRGSTRALFELFRLTVLLLFSTIVTMILLARTVAAGGRLRRRLCPPLRPAVRADQRSRHDVARALALGRRGPVDQRRRRRKLVVRHEPRQRKVAFLALFTASHRFNPTSSQVSPSFA